MISITQLVFLSPIGSNLVIIILAIATAVYSDEKCVLPKPIEYLDQEWVNHPSESNPNNVYYHFAGSLSGLKRYAEIIKGSTTTVGECDSILDNKDEKLEDVICLHESWKPNVESGVVQWLQIGYGTKGVHRQCQSVEGKSIVNSCHLTTTPNLFQEPPKFNATNEHVTLTDNKSYVVFVQCWEDGLRDWHAVVPLHKNITEESKQIILNHVKDIGFSIDRDMYFPKYDRCSEYYN